MGTRSLTVFKSNHGQDIAVLYRQYDGYIDGHGQELIDFLKPFEITNGISGDDKNRKTANGVECLAAQATAHFKKEVGQFYLYPSGTRDCGEEFTYIVSEKNGKPYLEIHEGTVAFFGQPGSVPAEEMPCIWKGFARDFSPEQVATMHH